MAQKKQKDTLETRRAKIIDAALSLAPAFGWNAVKLSDIAKEAGISAAELRDLIEDKTDILLLLGRQIDKQVIAAMEGCAPSDYGSVKEHLFDVMMERFEALNERREGVLAILDSIACDPAQLVIACPHLCYSMRWMLDLAGFETSGWRGALRVAGLTGLYVKLLRTWKRDESADLAQLMAELDRSLSRVDSAARSLGL